MAEPTNGPAPATDASTPTALVLPNLVVAGVTKAGTSSLFTYLGQHPDIAVPAVKEVDHYSPMVSGDEPEGLAAYAAHFADLPRRRYLVDASPRYFIGGSALVERVRRDLTAAGRAPRVLIALREPVARIWSSYTYKRSKDRLPEGVDFAEFVRRGRQVYDEGSVRDPASQAYRALAVGVYADYLGDWIDGFGEDLRIVFAEHLRRPRQEMASVFEWLGLDAAPVEGFDLRARNATYQPRSQQLRRLAVGLNGRLASRLGDGSPVKAALRSAYGRLNTGSLGEQLSEADRRVVEDFYAPHRARLRALLTAHGTLDLPEWLGQ